MLIYRMEKLDSEIGPFNSNCICPIKRNEKNGTTIYGLRFKGKIAFIEYNDKDHSRDMSNNSEFPNSSHFFGCKSIDELSKWFGDINLANVLSIKGYVVQTYCIPDSKIKDNVYFGNNQLTFNKSIAEKKQSFSPLILV